MCDYESIRMVENLKIRMSIKRTVLMSSRSFLTFYIHIFNTNEIIMCVQLISSLAVFS